MSRRYHVEIPGVDASLSSKNQSDLFDGPLVLDSLFVDHCYLDINNANSPQLVQTFKTINIKIINATFVNYDNANYVDHLHNF